MSEERSCEESAVESTSARGASRLRPAGEVAGWVVPGATLVLLPKCPACVAAYLALCSGISVSVATAMYLRTALLMVCGGALLFLAFRRAWGSVRTRRRRPQIAAR